MNATTLTFLETIETTSTFIGNLKSAAALIALSLVAHLAQWLMGKNFHFSLGGNATAFTLHSIGTLPALCAGIVLVKGFNIRALNPQHFVVCLYLGTLLLLNPFKSLALLLIVATLVLFYSVNKLGRSRTSVGICLALAFSLLYFPVLAYTLRWPLSPTELSLLLLYKTCLAMRLVSWIIDRKIYHRKDFSSAWDFLEFIFCPIFFLFPGQIQYFTFRYFHEQKAELAAGATRAKTLAIGFWGLGLMVLFSWMNWLFWKKIYPMPGSLPGDILPLYHLGTGVFWLVAVYFQQASGMAFQICMGRFLGYQIKYDMHYPLLARSPLDYLRRHSSYVRDYIVEVGFRPLALPLSRWRLRPAYVFMVAGIASYALLILPQTGYRADFDRPWLVSLTLLAFLALYLLLPVLGPGDSIAGAIDFKPMTKWTPRDYAAWLGTLLLLSASKAALGLVRAYSLHN